MFLVGCQSAVTESTATEDSIDQSKIYTDLQAEIDADGQLLVMDVTTEDLSFYDQEVQDQISYHIESLQEETGQLDHPLFIKNPFGTLSQSIYGYLEDEDGKIGGVEYTVKAEEAEDFTARAINRSTHPQAFEFIMVGLVPGRINQVSIDILDQDDQPIHHYTLDLEVSDVQGEDYGNQVEIIEDHDSDQLSPGWFASMGSSKNNAGYAYFFDNHGSIRSELVTDGGRIENYERLDGQHMLIKVSNEKLAVLNGLGQPVRIYELDGYTMHHDFELSDDGKGVFLLTNELETGTIEDTVLYLDLQTGEYEKIIDLREILSGYYEPVMANYEDRAQEEMDAYLAQGKEIEGQAIGEDEYPTTYFDEEGQLNNLDWIHINSIDILNEDEAVLSARENSSIIKLSNILDGAELDYIIGMPEVWNGSGYEEYLLHPLSDFKPTGGQHTVFFQSNEIDDGFYDLTLFDNNYWRMSSRPDYEGPIPNEMNDDTEGADRTPSYHYTLRVNENERTYDLVKSIPLPYSSIVSSSQVYKGNYITNSGIPNIVGEYNKDGELIRQYQYSIPEWGYRIKKIDFKDFLYR